jgi:hypothetical protein
MLKPQDILVLLKLSIEPERPTYLRLAQQLHLNPSEVHASVKRARAAHLLQGPPEQERVNRSGLLELLLHGLRYVFPAEKGALTRGVPTAYAASPLKEQIAPDGEPVPVWPYAEGTVRGYSFSPLHKNAPLAALEDQRFYELLALVDALREGRAREVPRPLSLHAMSRLGEGLLHQVRLPPSSVGQGRRGLEGSIYGRKNWWRKELLRRT